MKKDKQRMILKRCYNMKKQSSTPITHTKV